MSLSADIESLFNQGASADRDAARKAFFTLQRALGDGSVRSAQPDPDTPTGWRVNTWVKQGILLGFRFGDLADLSIDGGAWPFYDKDTMPLKRPGLESRVRIVPGGSAVREGAYLAPGVICVLWTPAARNPVAFSASGSSASSSSPASCHETNRS